MAPQSRTTTILPTAMQPPSSYVPKNFAYFIPPNFASQSDQNNVNATAGPASEQLIETVMVDPAYNISDVEEYFNSFFYSLNSTMQLYVRSYKNGVGNCVRSAATAGNYSAKLDCVQRQIQGFVGSQVSTLAPLKAMLLAIEFAGLLVVQSATSIVFGTFRLICGCGN